MNMLFVLEYLSHAKARKKLQPNTFVSLHLHWNRKTTFTSQKASAGSYYSCTHFPGTARFVIVDGPYVAQDIVFLRGFR
jgi:hypothetical protein